MCLQGVEHLLRDTLGGKHLVSSADALDSDHYSRVITESKQKPFFGWLMPDEGRETETLLIKNF